MAVSISPRALRAAAVIRWLLVATMAAAVFVSVLLLRAPRSEPASAFACPMHPSVVDDHRVNCPICGMALEPVHGLRRPTEARALPRAEGAASHVPGLVAVSLTEEEIRRSVIGVVPVRARADAGLEVPAHAVLEGPSGTYVFVTRDRRLFTPAAIEIQSSTRNYAYPVTGLSPEDEVVVVGATLLDAESRLRATLAGAAETRSP